jgi:hypothetical protein
MDFSYALLALQLYDQHLRLFVKAHQVTHIRVHADLGACNVARYTGGDISPVSESRRAAIDLILTWQPIR